jgi:Tol biopolymer transport system component
MDGRSLRPLAATSRIEMEPSWSPDGTRVAFHSESELWIRDADGASAMRLARQEDAGSVFAGRPRFSPDGGRVASLYGKEVRIYPAKGGRAAVLSSEASGRQTEDLDWAPDGSAVVITSNGRVLKVETNAVMSRTELVPKGANGPVSWSPDGTTIAYIADDGVRAVPSNGGASEARIPGTFRAGLFDRSGRLFYALRFQDMRQRITVFDWATGRELRDIDLDVDPALTVISFDLHPDGQRMALTAGQLKYDLWMLTGYPQPGSGMFHWWRPWTEPLAPTGD